MVKGLAPATPEEYLAGLAGWQKESVAQLRDAVLSAAGFEERLKWGHLVFFANGPVLLIRAEEARVLFGFWRGKRLMQLEPKLKPGGKYEMAALTFREEDVVDMGAMVRLAAEAHRLNLDLGDPTKF